MMFFKFLLLDIQKLYWTTVIKVQKFLSGNEQYRSQLAAHEAGHTVTVLCASTMELLESTIDVEGLAGRCNFWVDNSKDKTQTVVEQMIICLGGLAGELIADHKLVESAVCDIKDFFRFKQSLADWRTAAPTTTLIPLKLCLQCLSKNNLKGSCTQDDVECFQHFLSIAVQLCRQHSPLFVIITNHLKQHDRFTTENL